MSQYIRKKKSLILIYVSHTLILHLQDIYPVRVIGTANVIKFSLFSFTLFYKLDLINYFGNIYVTILRRIIELNNQDICVYSLVRWINIASIH